MIMLWLAGDLMKTAFYSKISAPVQLMVCACFQILLDVLILWQFSLYRPKPALHVPATDDEAKRLSKVSEELSSARELGHDEPLKSITTDP